MGGQPSNVKQTSTVKLSPEQKDIFNLAMPYATQYASTPPQTYSGQTIADLTPQEIQAQQMSLGAALGPQQDIANSTAAAQNFLASPDILSPDSNPYLRASGESVSDIIMRQLTENALPALRAGSTVAGGMYSGGNTRGMVAEGLAADRTTQNIGSALTNLYSDAYKSGLSAMEGAVRNSPIAATTATMPASTVAAVGAQNRAIEQARMDEAQRQFYLQQSLPLLRAQELLGLVTGMPGGTNVSQVQGAQPGSSPVTGALGGAMAGGSIGGPPGALIGGGLGLLMSILNR